jgi:hypothetical protein
MKILITVGVLAGLSAAAYAQDDADSLRRAHEKAMRDLDKRQKAEREALERKFREQEERADKPRADLEKRCDDLLRQIEKLAAEVRKLQADIAPAKSAAKSVVERAYKVIEAVPNKSFEYRIVPRKGGDKNQYEFELEEALKKAVPFKKRILEDDDRNFRYEFMDEDELDQVVPRVLEEELRKAVPFKKRILEGELEEVPAPKAKKKIVVEEDE